MAGALLIRLGPWHQTQGNPTMARNISTSLPVKCIIYVLCFMRWMMLPLLIGAAPAVRNLRSACGLVTPAPTHTCTHSLQAPAAARAPTEIASPLICKSCHMTACSSIALSSIIMHVNMRSAQCCWLVDRCRTSAFGGPYCMYRLLCLLYRSMGRVTRCRMKSAAGHNFVVI